MHRNMSTPARLVAGSLLAAALLGSVALGKRFGSDHEKPVMARELGYVAPGGHHLQVFYEDEITGCQYIGPDTTRGDHVRMRPDGKGQLCIPREGIYSKNGTPSPVVDPGPRR